MDGFDWNLEWTSERKEHRTAALIIGDNENDRNLEVVGTWSAHHKGYYAAVAEELS